MRNGFTMAAGVIVLLVLAKDGTLGTLIGNAATFAQNGVKGLKPIVTAA